MFQDIQSEASKELEPAHLYLFLEAFVVPKHEQKKLHKGYLILWRKLAGYSCRVPQPIQGVSS